jgi:hypothetical protein
MIGRGTTTLVYEKDKDTVLVFTRDTLKEEFIRIILKMSTYVDEFRVFGHHHIRGACDFPIMVFEMSKLYPLSPANRKIVQKEIDRFEKVYFGFKNNNKYNDAHQQVSNYYNMKYPDSVLLPAIDWFANYNHTQFVYDFHLGNFMQTKDGTVVPIDPVVDTEILEIIKKHQQRRGLPVMIFDKYMHAYQ